MDPTDAQNNPNNDNDNNQPVQVTPPLDPATQPQNPIPPQQPIAAPTAQPTQTAIPTQAVIQPTPVNSYPTKKKVSPLIYVGITVLVMFVAATGVAILGLISRGQEAYIPTVSAITDIQNEGYKPSAEKTWQMEGRDAVLNSKQTVSFKLSSICESNKELSDKYYSGDPVFSCALTSGKSFQIGIYTAARVINADDFFNTKWRTLDEVVKTYADEQSGSLADQSSVEINGRKWVVIFTEKASTDKNANKTVFISIDNKDSYEDLAYFAELMTPVLMSKSDYEDAIKDTEYALSSITTKVDKSDKFMTGYSG